MAIADFAVTAAAVRAHHYPHFPAFSSGSNPTAVTVAEAIVDATADLSGKLRLKNLDPTDIDDDTTSEAYKWCAQTIRLDAAIRIYTAVTGQDPPKSMTAALKARLDALEDSGGTVLGLGASAEDDTEPEGPTTHINEHALETADTTLMSDVTPPFRKNDEL